MKRLQYIKTACAFLCAFVLCVSCAKSQERHILKKAQNTVTLGGKTMKHEKEIFLAGGCFWGVEAYFERLPGVALTETGYANGKTDKTTNYPKPITRKPSASSTILRRLHWKNSLRIISESSIRLPSIGRETTAAANTAPAFTIRMHRTKETCKTFWILCKKNIPPRSLLKRVR